MELKAQRSKLTLVIEDVVTPDEYLEYCETYNQEPSEEDFQGFVKEYLLSRIFEDFCFESEIVHQDA